MRRPPTSGPVTSTMTDSGARSTTRPFDSSTSFRISARFESVARILTSASSWPTVGSARDVLDLEDVDQPVELLCRLLDRDVVAVEGDRHPADVRLVGLADGQRVDVEVAGPHERRDPVQDAGLVEDDRDQRVAPRLAAAGQRARRRPGVDGPTRARRPATLVGRRRPVGTRGCGKPLPLPMPQAELREAIRPRIRPSFVRPVPFLDQVGQALAGGHHREDVLLLGHLEPDQRRTVDGLGRPDRVVDLVRRLGAERRDAVGVGELLVVGTQRWAEW